MSFNVCRGTLGSVAMFIAIRNARRASVDWPLIAGSFPRCEMSPIGA